MQIQNQPGIAVDVKTSLYIQVRFKVILVNKLLKYNEEAFISWVITNAKLTAGVIEQTELIVY